MSYETRLADNGRGVIVEYYGFLTSEELWKSLSNRFFSGKDFSGLLYNIGDASRVGQVEISSDDIVKFAEIFLGIMKQNSEFVSAYVAPKDMEFGLGRVFLGYTSTENERLFIARDRAEAEKWVTKKVKEKFNIDVFIK